MRVAKSLKCRENVALSRQRSRVRVSSSPPAFSTTYRDQRRQSHNNTQQSCVTLFPGAHDQVGQALLRLALWLIQGLMESMRLTICSEVICVVGRSFALAASVRRQRRASAWDPMNVAAEQTVYKSDLIGNQQTKDKAKHSGCHRQIPSQAGKPLLAIDEC